MLEAAFITILGLACFVLLRVAVASQIQYEQLHMIHDRMTGRIDRGEIKSLEEIDQAYEQLKNPGFNEIVLTPWWWTRWQVYGD